MSGLLLHTHPGVRVIGPDAGTLEVRSDATIVRFEQLHDKVAESICVIVSRGGRQGPLVEAVRSEAGSIAVVEFLHCLHQLFRSRLLWRSVQEDQRVLVTLQPGDRHLPPTSPLPSAGVTHALSRFSFLRPGNEGFALETANDSGRLLIHDTQVLSLIGELAHPVGVDELCARCPCFSEATVLSVLQLLWDGDFLDGREGEPDPAKRCWEFHDLLFHTRSRLGRHHQPSGGTYRFLGELDCPPALLQPPPDAQLVELSRPCEHGVETRALDGLMAARRSVRRYGPDPITVAELGSFLYRTARVTRLEQSLRMTDRGVAQTEVAYRPYPGGGGLYEYEIYVAVNRCRGLAPGLYHYYPARHALEVRASGFDPVSRLLRLAATAAGMKCEDTQLLLVLAARFGRVAWKYSSMAYATILKDAGVLLQTMYLVATAMRLGPCAIGCGDSEEFANLSGADYYSQGSVAELLLGSREE